MIDPMLVRGTLLILLSAIACAGQFTIREVVNLVSARDPGVAAAAERAAAAHASVRLARTTYLPQANLLGQVNRATHNNVFGLLEPQPLPVISSITGPVLGTNNNDNVWGSAVGAYIGWEPFDFGLRRSKVAEAKATAAHAEAETALAKLQLAAAAADAFLTIQAARLTAEAAQAGATRANTLRDITDALARNQLRPGADASRAAAEYAAQQNRVIEAQENAALAQAALETLLGAAVDRPLDTAFLSRLPAGPAFGQQSVTESTLNETAHPAMLLRSAALTETHARQTELTREYFPKFTLEATSFARGTGVTSSGHDLGGANGLGPTTQNWALGMSVTFSLFDFAAIRAREEREAHNERALRAEYQNTLQEVNGEITKARIQLEAARKMAANTPVQLNAAETAERQAKARYQAGLGAIAEVADAQRLFTQSQIDDHLARLSVWRALLRLSFAQGDLTPFLDEASR